MEISPEGGAILLGELQQWREAFTRDLYSAGCSELLIAFANLWLDGLADLPSPEYEYLHLDQRQLTRYALVHELDVEDRTGLCHHLANEDRLIWVPL